MTSATSVAFALVTILLAAAITQVLSAPVARPLTNPRRLGLNLVAVVDADVDEAVGVGMVVVPPGAGSDLQTKVACLLTRPRCGSQQLVQSLSSCWIHLPPILCMIIWTLLILYAILVIFLILLPTSLHVLLKIMKITLIEARVGIRPPGPYAKYVFFVLRLTATTIGLLT